MFKTTVDQNIAMYQCTSERIPSILLASQGGGSNVPGVQDCSETNELLFPNGFLANSQGCSRSTFVVFLATAAQTILANSNADKRFPAALLASQVWRVWQALKSFSVNSIASLASPYNR